MLYYIQNTNAGHIGNSPVWWALKSQGYTANLDKAQKFTEADAKKICLGNPEKNKAWPIDHIDNHEGIQRVIDHQFMDRSNIKVF